MPTQEQFEKRAARWGTLAGVAKEKDAAKARLLRKRMKRAQRRALTLKRRAAKAAKPSETPAAAQP